METCRHHSLRGYTSNTPSHPQVVLTMAKVTLEATPEDDVAGQNVWTAAVHMGGVRITASAPTESMALLRLTEKLAGRLEVENEH